MKAHQNQDMRNDEMNDHAIYMEWRNLREVAYVINLSHGKSWEMTLSRDTEKLLGINTGQSGLSGRNVSIKM